LTILLDGEGRIHADLPSCLDPAPFQHVPDGVILSNGGETPSMNGLGMSSMFPSFHPPFHSGPSQQAAYARLDAARKKFPMHTKSRQA
jgi:hypothetical protein